MQKKPLPSNWIVIIYLILATLLLAAAIIFGGCAREYSCEGCYERTLITSYSIYITPTSVARVIYPAVKTPMNPGHYQFIDSIFTTTLDTTYSGSYDLLNYFHAVRGDTFYVFYEVRGRLAFTEQVQHDTLIY